MMTEGQAEDVFENVSFRIDTDWKLGLIGRNGREKTTFLKLLSGNILTPERFLPQLNSNIFPVLYQILCAVHWKSCRKFRI